jgi:hypothetical protein
VNVDPERFLDTMLWLVSCLQRVDAKLDKLLQGANVIMADLSELTAEVTRNTSVEQSALTLIQGLAAQIAAAGTDPVKLKALQVQLTANDDALAAAIAANTPAAPPTPTPAPAP